MERLSGEGVCHGRRHFAHGFCRQNPATTVGLIADQSMAGKAHVNPDLMGPPGFQPA